MVNSVYPEKRTEEITGTSGLVKWAFFPRYCTNLVSRSQTALPLHITHAEVTTTFLFCCCPILSRASFQSSTILSRRISFLYELPAK